MYTPIELIVVDDGSTDHTLSVVKKFKGAVIIHKENGGCSSARNAGVKAAKGKYVMFIDSDEWIEPDFVEAYMNAISDFENTIVMSDFLINGTKKHIWESMEIEGTINIFNEYLKSGICNRKVNKIYPKHIVDDVLFLENRNKMEDAVWTSMIIMAISGCLLVYGLFRILNFTLLPTLIDKTFLFLVDN